MKSRILLLVVWVVSIVSMLPFDLRAENIRSGHQTINGTRVFTEVFLDRGYARFSNECGSQTISQLDLQRGALPTQIIPCGAAGGSSANHEERSASCGRLAEMYDRQSKELGAAKKSIAAHEGNAAALCQFGQATSIPLLERHLKERASARAESCWDESEERRREEFVKVLEGLKKSVADDCRLAQSKQPAAPPPPQPPSSALSGSDVCSCFRIKQLPQSGSQFPWQAENRCDVGVSYTIIDCDSDLGAGGGRPIYTCKESAFHESAGSKGMLQYNWKEPTRLVRACANGKCCAPR